MFIIGFEYSFAETEGERLPTPACYVGGKEIYKRVCLVKKEVCHPVRCVAAGARTGKEKGRIPMKKVPKMSISSFVVCLY